VESLVGYREVDDVARVRGARGAVALGQGSGRLCRRR
jgi:hypothetical protein